MGWSTTTRPSPHFSGSQQRASSTSPCRRTGPLQSGFRTLFNRGDFRTTSTSGAGRSRRSGNHVGHVGPVRESGVAAILVHEEVGATGSGCCPLQVWTRMLLHGHMRGSMRREICDFQASISPDHLKYQEFPIITDKPIVSQRLFFFLVRCPNGPVKRDWSN